MVIRARCATTRTTDDEARWLVHVVFSVSKAWDFRLEPLTSERSKVGQLLKHTPSLPYISVKKKKVELSSEKRAKITSEGGFYFPFSPKKKKERPTKRKAISDAKNIEDSAMSTCGKWQLEEPDMKRDRRRNTDNYRLCGIILIVTRERRSKTFLCVRNVTFNPRFITEILL